MMINIEYKITKTNCRDSTLEPGLTAETAG